MEITPFGKYIVITKFHNIYNLKLEGISWTIFLPKLNYIVIEVLVATAAWTICTITLVSFISIISQA